MPNAYVSGASGFVGDVTNHESLLRTTPENVDGTRSIVDVALRKGAARFVQTSSFVAFGPQDGDVLGEDSESKAHGHRLNYFRTEYLSDNEILAGIEKGLDDTHQWLEQEGRIQGPPFTTRRRSGIALSPVCTVWPRS